MQQPKKPGSSTSTAHASAARPPVDEQYDVLIMGGGMVGATLACALKDSGLRIAVLEHQPPQAFSAGQPHDLRVSALSLASKNILQNLGVWSDIEQMRLCPLKRMRVWEQAGVGDTLFDAGDLSACEQTDDASALAYIVENRLVQLALWKQIERSQPHIQHDASNTACVHILAPSAVQRIDYRGTAGTHITLVDGRRLHGQLLVAADGGQSQAREAAGIGVHRWQYPQQALVAYVETAYPQQDITWQRFVAAGPQAFLPLTGQYASLVWYEHPDEVKRLLALSDEDFHTQLKRRFPEEVGDIRRIIRRASFPLNRQHALDYCKEGVVLVGDAAHMIHPLAGQGVNIGLLDAAVLAEVILDALQHGKRFSSAVLLGEYEQRRRAHNLAMMTVMDMFYRSFSSEQLPVKALRNIGLGLTQHLAPVKHQVMGFAMGLDGAGNNSIKLPGPIQKQLDTWLAKHIKPLHYLPQLARPS